MEHDENAKDSAGTKREKLREALTQPKGVGSLADRMRKQQAAVEALLSKDDAGGAGK